MTDIFSALLRSASRRRATLRLLELDDHLLNDIGLTRQDIRAGRADRMRRA